MAVFGFLKNKRISRGRVSKKAQKVEFQPKVIYNPKKSNLKNKNRSKIAIKRGSNIWKPLLATIIGILVIILIWFLISSLYNSDTVRIKEFKLLGNRTINDSQVLAVLDKYSGQSIFTANTELISNDLRKEFNIFNGVTVTKFYPDTLYIRISEREPRLVYVNLSGAFLIDANGQILRKIFIDPVLMSEEKLNIARGFGDPNSEYLQEIFVNEFKVNNQLLDMTLEEQKLLIASSFNYEEITADARMKRINKLETEYKAELLAIWEKLNQAVDISVYSTYPRVDAMDTNVYEEDDSIDIERLDISSDLINLFSARKIQINRIIWEGELLIRVITVDNKELVFGSVRKITEQFEDYILVLSQLQKEGRDYCQIDLSATKIAVRSCR